MTKQEAMTIAKNLSEAVVEGYISEEQAKRNFRKVASKYKQRKRFNEYLKSDPNMTYVIGKLLGRQA